MASYPTEIYGVSPPLAEHAGRFAKLISNRFPFTVVRDTFHLALTPDAPEKIFVTVGD